MLNLLITGEKGYIGTSLIKHLVGYPDKYKVERMGMRDDGWREKNLSGFDVIIHASGMAHTKQTKKNTRDFYAVNYDMTVKLAEKAKSDGVKRFIFISSMSVYGMFYGKITHDTLPNPVTAYGESKIMAEDTIKSLDDDQFSVIIIRPPMVYGENCRGNFASLKKMAMWLPFFFDIDNERSMIYIGNLCECIRLLTEDGVSGTYFPQDRQYTKTSEMVYLVAKCKGRNLKLTKIFNPIIRFAAKKINFFSKIFGSLTYDMEMSRLPKDYILTDNYKAICLSVSSSDKGE